MNTNEVTDCLHRYLLALEQIVLIKQDLKAIEEEAAKLPGVEKRPFKAIAQALHQAPGNIEEKFENMANFIRLAFQTEEQKP